MPKKSAAVEATRTPVHESPFVHGDSSGPPVTNVVIPPERSYRSRQGMKHPSKTSSRVSFSGVSKKMRDPSGEIEKKVLGSWGPLPPAGPVETSLVSLAKRS